MKKAGFVYNVNDIREKYEHPWKKERIYNSKSIDFEPGDGLVLFRRDFKIPEDTVSVKIRATALGIFELYLNGMRIGSVSEGAKVYDELKPTWTDFTSRVFEYEYDITDMCGGKNTLVAEVSPGWWCGRISFGFYGFKPRAFCGEIEFTLKDGKTKYIYKDWKTAIGGKVRRADIWDGEYFDARVADPCLEPGKYEWTDAIPFADTSCKIVKPVGEPIRVREDLERHPVSTVVHKGTEDNGSDFGRIHVLAKKIGAGCEKLKLADGESVILDFGQNMVGRPRLIVKAAAGTVIKGYFAELLNDSGIEARGNDGPEGGMYIKNYRTALARLTYVAAGEGEETFVPLHTFYGFRYFELTADADIEIVSVAGEVITSAIAETGYIETDNAEVNKLISNIRWGQRGNYLSIPTDCPQRDERLGWTGDTQIFCGAASYLSDINSFMKKWLGDARDSQKNENGAYCDVIPRVFAGKNNGNAAWGEAGIIVPWRLWLMYRDYDTVAEHYDSMEAYMNYLGQFGLEGPNTAYGDWLNYEITDKRYIAVCYYACVADLMIKFSKILGKADRAEFYTDLRRRIGEHFSENYIVNGELTQKTQTAYLLALKFNLLPGDMREKSVKALEKKIIDNNYTLSTGFVGTGVLNQTLSEVGLDRLCYSLLLQSADPSWLYSVRQGATTIWERWNSYTKATGFGNVGMNSFNHYAYGAVAEWMFSKMAGISPDEDNPGFGKFILCPRPDTREPAEIPAGQDKIKRVYARYDSVKGRIESSWEYENGEFVYKCTIPVGTSARVEFPLLNGRDNAVINGIVFTPTELSGEINDGRLIFVLGEGSYTIK